MAEGQTPQEVVELRKMAAALEEEVAYLRRRLRESPHGDSDIERELQRTRERLDRAVAQNDKIAQLLEEAREQLGVLREEVEKLTQPPNNFGTVLQVNSDGTVDVLTGNRKLRVNAQPNVEVKLLQVGQEVLLNEAFNIIDVRQFEPSGEVLRVRDVMVDGRVVLIGHGDEERSPAAPRPCWTSVSGRATTSASTPRRVSSSRRWNGPRWRSSSSKRSPTSPTRRSVASRRQIEQIRDTVELPYLHRDLFKEYHLEPPKGILLYGPPGCGKTLIAKAVANSLAQKVAEMTGNPDVRSYFLNIKGPELLNKWVGETERQIRLIFQRAKEKSDEGVPVIVFFDEMDSLFRTRGTGISSDVESTIVPQLLSELDGVESLKNVVVIGASNREDLIDPAILRPGRLDVKIKINRPDPVAAREIFRIYLTDETPIDPEELARFGSVAECIERMIESTVDRMYSRTTRTASSRSPMPTVIGRSSTSRTSPRAP